MEIPSYLDKSTTRTNTRVIRAGNLFCEDFRLSTKELILNFAFSSWFATRLQSEGVVDLLDFAIDGQEVQTLQALLYAYSHPGTPNSIIALCLGLFGAGSVTLDESTPCVVGINVSNANLQFLAGLIDNLNRAIDDSLKNRWVTIDVFTSLSDTDLATFLLQFLPVGYKLVLTIDEG